MKLFFILTISMFLSNSAVASPDPLQLAKLTEIIRQMNQQLKYARNTLDVQEQIKEMQQAELVQEVSQGGKHLWRLANEIEYSQNLIGSFGNIDDDFKDLKDDINNYFHLYEKAGNEEEALRSLKKYSYAIMTLDDQYWLGSESPNRDRLYEFSRMINDLERINTIRSSQEENLISLSKGVSAKEAAIISATDNNTALSLIIEDHYRDAADRANQAYINSEDEKSYRTFMNYDVDVRDNDYGG